jgi:hypothetical protein
MLFAQKFPLRLKYGSQNETGTKTGLNLHWLGHFSFMNCQTFIYIYIYIYINKQGLVNWLQYCTAKDF